jgi:hypothetical protein
MKNVTFVGNKKSWVNIKKLSHDGTDWWAERNAKIFSFLSPYDSALEIAGKIFSWLLKILIC